jgi:MFS family permease
LLNYKLTRGLPYSVMASLCTIVPLFVQNVFMWNSLGAGLIFLCVAVPTASGYVAGCLTDHYGARAVAVLGFIVTTPALLLLRLVDHNTLTQKVLLCAVLVLVGTGLSLFLAPLATDINIVADKVSQQTSSSLLATSFSILNCAIALGGALGPLTAGPMMNSTGWKGATMLISLICLIGIPPCVSQACSSQVQAQMLTSMQLIWSGNKGSSSIRKDLQRLRVKMSASGTTRTPDEAPLSV